MTSVKQKVHGNDATTLTAWNTQYVVPLGLETPLCPSGHSLDYMSGVKVNAVMTVTKGHPSVVWQVDVVESRRQLSAGGYTPSCVSLIY